MEESIMNQVRHCWGGRGTTGRFQLHDVCGDNIDLNRNRTSAYRRASFSHGLCFSHCPILPGQLFLVEISDAQDGWSGNLRIGVTQHDPRTLDPVPEMVIPDMTTGGAVTEEREITKGGQTWATAVTKFHNRIRGRNKEIIGDECDVISSGYDATKDLIDRRSDVMKRENNIAKYVNQRITVKNFFFLARKELTFNAAGRRFPDFGQSVFIGSRIGITLVPVNSDTGAEISSEEEKICISEKWSFTLCNMHLIINGEDQGPCATLIPMDRPLFVVMDIYSTTKQVKIIPTSYIGSLKDLVRDKIRSLVRKDDDIDILPLPNAMKKFCLYK